jgi:Rickettsia 17 kDa surface antigen.
MTFFAFQHRWLRPVAVCCLGVSATISALFPPMAEARPWWRSHAGQSNGYGAPVNNGYQAYGTPSLTPEQQVQRCNLGRLIGGLGGGAAAYAMSRDDGRSWAIPLGALLGSQVGCNTAAGRGPLPW